MRWGRGGRRCRGPFIDNIRSASLPPTHRGSVCKLMSPRNVTAYGNSMYSCFHNKGDWIQFERNPGTSVCCVGTGRYWNHCTWRSGGNTIATGGWRGLTSILVTAKRIPGEIPHSEPAVPWSTSRSGPKPLWRWPHSFTIERRETTRGSQLALNAAFLWSSFGKLRICWGGHFPDRSKKKKGGDTLYSHLDEWPHDASHGEVDECKIKHRKPGLFADIIIHSWFCDSRTFNEGHQGSPRWRALG